MQITSEKVGRRKQLLSPVLYWILNWSCSKSRRGCEGVGGVPEAGDVPEVGRCLDGVDWPV